MAHKQATHGPRPKHVPQRTCITCRRTETKRGLMRIVRDEAGRVAFDPTGKRAGRGAYMCHSPACWEQALKRHGLERALKIERIDPEDRLLLEQMARTVAAEAASEGPASM